MSIRRVAQTPNSVSPLSPNSADSLQRKPAVQKKQTQSSSQTQDEYKPSNSLLGMSGGMIGGALTGAAVLGIANATVAIGEITAEKGLSTGAKVIHGAFSGTTALALGGISGVIAGGVSGAVLGGIAGTFIGSTIENDTAAAIVGGIAGLAIGAGLLYMTHDKLAGIAGAAIGAGSGALSSYAVSKNNSSDQ